jgi:hypothetical protein
MTEVPSPYPYLFCEITNNRILEMYIYSEIILDSRKSMMAQVEESDALSVNSYY